MRQQITVTTMRRAGAALLLAFLLVAVSTTAESNTSSSSSLTKSWTLYHSWGTGEESTALQPRGRVQLEISDGGGETSSVELTMENEADCLTETAVEAMLSAGWYQLKLVEDNDGDGGGNGEKSPDVITTVPSCLLRRANFRYVHLLHSKVKLHTCGAYNTRSCRLFI